MAVAHGQTVEDGGPRRPLVWHLLQAGTVEESIRIEMVIRRPCSLLDFTHRLVVRARRADEVITMALERVLD